MTEIPWYNKGLFSSLNLRQKTLLTIGLDFIGYFHLRMDD